MRLVERYIQQERVEMLSTVSRKLDNIFAELFQQLQWFELFIWLLCIV